MASNFDRRTLLSRASAVGVSMLASASAADAVVSDGHSDDGIALVHRTVTANGIRQHYVEAGAGPPVLLLHGFPETWFAWRKQIPVLARNYRVIVPDLRGYGDTEKPEVGYDKRTMANDALALMDSLGIKRAAILGHDRGARVATRFAKDHPDRIARLGIFDNIPTTVIFDTLSAKNVKGYWFFIFNQLSDGLPEALIAGKEEVWLRYFFRHWSYDPSCITDEEVAVYVKSYQQSGAVHGACMDYRAAAVDLEQDRVDATTKIACPTLVMWGRDFDLLDKNYDIAEIWRERASQVTAIGIDQCGHLSLEEKPDVVNRAVTAFLADWKG